MFAIHTQLLINEDFSRNEGKELNSRSQLPAGHMAPGVTRAAKGCRQRLRIPWRQEVGARDDCAHLCPLEKLGFEKGIGVFHWAQNEGFSSPFYLSLRTPAEFWVTWI